MSENNDSKVAQVRALLDKAASTEFPEEAESFLEGAMRLMAKYDIQEDAVRAADPSKRDQVVSKIITVKGLYYYQRSMILAKIAMELGCRVVILGGGRGDKYVALDIMGREGATEDTAVLFAAADLHCSGEVKRLGDAIDFPNNGAKKAWKHSFIMGYASTVAQKMRKATKEAEQGAKETYGDAFAQGVALERVETKEAVQRFEKDKYPKLGTTVRSSGTSSAGRNAGRKAGEQFGGAGTGVGSGTRGAIGSGR